MQAVSHLLPLMDVMEAHEAHANVGKPAVRVIKEIAHTDKAHTDTAKSEDTDAAETPAKLAVADDASIDPEELLAQAATAASAQSATPTAGAPKSKAASFADLLDETTSRNDKKRTSRDDHTLVITAPTQAAQATVTTPLKLSAPALALLLGGQVSADASEEKTKSGGAIVLPAGMTATKDIAAPAPVSAPAWVSRVMTEASLQAFQGGGTARLQVEVPQVGTCECKVTVRGDSVQVHLTVPPSQNQPLQPQLSAMSASLRSLGLHMTEVVVSISETAQSSEDAPKDAPQGDTPRDQQQETES